MKVDMNAAARRVMELAEGEARGMGHGYVGTEHVLLGLVVNGGEAGRVLMRRGLDVARVRGAVEEIVTRGGEVGARPLPWTPRAKRVVALAGEVARMVKQGEVGEGHLLLGLMAETEGVAGRVLAKLGVKAEEVRGEVLRVRVEQLKVVERAVRSVGVSVARKRRMREELLAHLTGIYEEELARVGDADLAMREAARRFGDPGELARELGRAIPWHERVAYRFEKVLGWRAPEPVWRFVLRQAGMTALAVAGIWCLVAGEALVMIGPKGVDLWGRLGPATGMVVLTPVCQFILGLLYYKMRDAMWGVFGSRRSPAVVAVLGLLIAAVVMGCGVALVGMTSGGFGLGPGGGFGYAAGGVFMAGVLVWQARVRGPGEIEDTVWACLEVG